MAAAHPYLLLEEASRELASRLMPKQQRYKIGGGILFFLVVILERYCCGPLEGEKHLLRVEML